MDRGPARLQATKARPRTRPVRSRWPMALAVAVVAAVTVTLAWSALRSSQRSREQRVLAEADRICQDANRRLFAVPAPQRPADIPSFTDATVPILSDEMSALENLANNHPTLHRQLGGVAEAIDGLRRAAIHASERVRRGATIDEVNREATAVDQAAEAVGNRAAALGLSNCGRPRPVDGG